MGSKRSFFTPKKEARSRCWNCGSVLIVSKNHDLDSKCSICNFLIISTEEVRFNVPTRHKKIRKRRIKKKEARHRKWYPRKEFSRFY